MMAADSSRNHDREQGKDPRIPLELMQKSVSAKRYYHSTQGYNYNSCGRIDAST